MTDLEYLQTAMKKMGTILKDTDRTDGEALDDAIELFDSVQKGDPNRRRGVVNERDSSMASALSKIYKFNKDRGLLEKGFDYDREAGFLMSESLELIDFCELEHELIVDTGRGGTKCLSNNHDEIAKKLVEEHPLEGLSDLDKQVIFVDTWVDQFVFGAGGGMKMGLPMGTLLEILHIVCDANLQKTGGVTEDGKQKKGTAFKSPDEQIREILIQNNINMTKEK